MGVDVFPVSSSVCCCKRRLCVVLQRCIKPVLFLIKKHFPNFNISGIAIVLSVSSFKGQSVRYAISFVVLVGAFVVLGCTLVGDDASTVKKKKKKSTFNFNILFS